MEQLIIDSEFSEIDKVRSFLKKNLLNLNLSEEEYFTIELSLLEICTNIVRYAYPENKDKIFLKTWRDKDKFFLEIRDNGIPFDPREAKEPDIKKILKTEQVGGLGILISRQFMDGFDYKREHNQNILIMFKKISA
jgi:anti-sigma regulatory factor (Ser/Thr protein kinase)